MCPSLENPDLVRQETGNSRGPRYSRQAKCGSRQAIQARPDHSNRMSLLPEVYQMICDRWHPPQVDLFATKVQQVTSVCFTSSRLHSLGSGCTQPALGGSEPLYLPKSSHSGKGVAKLKDYPCRINLPSAPCGPTSLFLGSGDYVEPNPTVPAQPIQSECVAPVVIPALTPTLGKSLKGDQSMSS